MRIQEHDSEAETRIRRDGKDPVRAQASEHSC